MKSICECEYFDEIDIRMLRRAEEIVAAIPDDVRSKENRCHEVARAVAQVLSLDFWEMEIVDGKYGFVDHSRLYYFRVAPKGVHLARLPMVQLIDLTPFSTHGHLYKPGERREDIRYEVVEDMIQAAVLKLGKKVFGKRR